MIRFDFWSRWFDRWIWDIPSLPWGMGMFNQESLLEEFHTSRLAKLLEFGDPYLFHQFYWDVVTPASCVRKKEQELTALKQNREELAAQVGSLQEELASMPVVPTEPEVQSAIKSPVQPDVKPDVKPKSSQHPLELPPKPMVNQWEMILTVGLSLMLFIGIAEFLGLDIQGLTLEQSPLLLLGLSGAICINLAEYLSIVRLVKAVRRYDPKRSYEDDKRVLANTIPFWQRLRKGDAAIWISMTIVVLETLFAAPGLISLLPPKISVQPIFQVTVFAAAGLAAMVNITMAWGDALAHIQWEQEVKAARRRYHKQQILLHEAEQKHQAALQEVEQKLQIALQEAEQNQEAVLQEVEEKLQTALQEEEQRYARWVRYHQKKEERDREIQDLRKELGGATKRLEAKNQEITKEEQRLRKLTEDARCQYERWELAVRRWLRENPDVLKRFQEVAPSWEQQDSRNGYSSQKNHYLHKSEDAKKPNSLMDGMGTQN